MYLALFAAVPVTASAGFLRVDVNMTDNMLGISKAADFGNPKCQCVGFDNVDGTTDVKGLHYPADLGARCEAWDDNVAKECTGPNPASWCNHRWCYVDPCKCEIADMPKISARMPDAQYQGKTLYYSYETCGSKDDFTAEHHKSACANQKTSEACKANEKCFWNSDSNKCGGKEIMQYCNKPLPVVKHGHRECKCVGIDGQEGTMEADVGGGKMVPYPADVGATCGQWDMGLHPECTGSEKADWCHDRWCFVDPCDCDHDHVAKASNFYPDSTFQGKRIFFSYLTCGSEDRYSAKHRTMAQKRQAEVCSSSGAWTLTPALAVLVSVLLHM